jgi:hypothetical protein
MSIVYYMKAYKTTSPSGYVTWNVNDNPDTDGTYSGYSPGDLENIFVNSISFTVSSGNSASSFDGYITVDGYIAVGTNPANAGIIRLPNNQDIKARNAGNNNNLSLIGSDSSNNIIIGQIGFYTEIKEKLSLTGGSNVFYIEESSSVPSVDPTGGGVLYVEDGSLKYRGPNGTITTIGAA